MDNSAYSDLVASSENPESRWGGSTVAQLDRDNNYQISRAAVLQALHRVFFPVNIRVDIVRETVVLGWASDFAGDLEPFNCVETRVTQSFIDPRRFVAWACREGFVPREFLRDCQRYARGL
jgi:hypothetical protein